MGCYAVSTGRRSPTLRRIVVLSPSGSSSPVHEEWTVLLDPEDEIRYFETSGIIYGRTHRNIIEDQNPR